jgi:hypothetical protein
VEEIGSAAGNLPKSDARKYVTSWPCFSHAESSNNQQSIYSVVCHRNHELVVRPKQERLVKAEVPLAPNGIEKGGSEIVHHKKLGTTKFVNLRAFHKHKVRAAPRFPCHRSNGNLTPFLSTGGLNYTNNVSRTNRKELIVKAPSQFAIL